MVSIEVAHAKPRLFMILQPASSNGNHIDALFLNPAKALDGHDTLVYTTMH